MPTSLRARSAAADVAGKNGHSLISNEKFRQLYAALLKYELIEEHLRSTSTNGTEDDRGHFAGAVGVMLDLECDDTVVLSPRTQAVGYVKGLQFRDLLHHHNGRGTGEAAQFGFATANVIMPPSAGAGAQAGSGDGRGVGEQDREEPQDCCGIHGRRRRYARKLH